MGNKRDFIYRLMFRIVFILAVCAGVKAQAMSRQDARLLDHAKLEAAQELSALQKQHATETRVELKSIAADPPALIGADDPTCDGGDCDDEIALRQSFDNVKSSAATGL